VGEPTSTALELRVRNRAALEVAPVDLAHCTLEHVKTVLLRLWRRMRPALSPRMSDDELRRRLEASDFEVGQAGIREDGVFLDKINDIFMFRWDVVDLVTGRATIAKILRRNKGKVFPKAPSRD